MLFSLLLYVSVGSLLDHYLNVYTFFVQFLRDLFFWQPMHFSA